MNYMGLDHHRQSSYVTSLDEEGKVLKSGRVANLRSEVEKFLVWMKEVKICARVRQLATKIKVQLPSSFPWKGDLWKV